MRVVIDACVLYPTFLRDLVLEWASTGAFTPLWSHRILEEWRRAAARNGPRDAEIATSEIAALNVSFPDALIEIHKNTASQVSLPDPDDVHVLAAAIEAEADELLTLNVRDFPTNVLAAHGIMRRHPDEFLLEGFHMDQSSMVDVVDRVMRKAASHGIDTSNRRALLKRAKLPRFGKALDQL